jgi:hypothetical protein
MSPLQSSYDKNIDSYIETNTEGKRKVRLIHENLLKRLPPDILREMARRQLAEIKKAGYDVSEFIPTGKDT